MKTPPTTAEIRAAREAAGLTQTSAAQLVHCNRSSWAEWEGGVSKMHLAFWELFKIKAAGRCKAPTHTP